jgi:hypothetical protein
MVSKHGLRQREERISVMIPSRMRVSNHWSDVCIRNISSRGLLVASSNPPGLGSYVEIRRGSHIIVARAVWTSGNYCGLRSQEKLPIQRIISEPCRAKRPEVAIDGAPFVERRAAARSRDSLAEREQRSRRFASLFQFAVFGALALGGAGWAATSVYELLAVPAEAVEEAIETR